MLGAMQPIATAACAFPAPGLAWALAMPQALPGAGGGCCAYLILPGGWGGETEAL